MAVFSGISIFSSARKPPPPIPPKETSVLSFPLHKGQSRRRCRATRIHRPHNPWRPEGKTSLRREKTCHPLLAPRQNPLHDVPGIFPQPVPTALPDQSASSHAPARLHLPIDQG